MLIFATPFFIVGQLLIWFSDQKIKLKLLLLVLPLILWYPSVLAFFFLASKKMTPETFLVPKEFRGQITLIYQEPCGETVPIINGRLTYKIPSNGIMIVSNKFETGIIDQEYYFVDKNWNKIEPIQRLIQQDFNEEYTLQKNKHEPPRNKVGLFLLGTGGGSTFKNENYQFHMMAVNSWDSLRIQNSNSHDSLVDELLLKCRQRKNYR